MNKFIIKYYLDKDMVGSDSAETLIGAGNAANLYCQGDGKSAWDMGVGNFIDYHEKNPGRPKRWATFSEEEGLSDE